MIYEGIAFVCIIAMIGISIIKLYNIQQKGKFYSRFFTFAGFILTLLVWGFYFLSFSALMIQTTTIVSGADVSTITSNSYVIGTMFLNVSNFFLMLNGSLSVIEVILGLIPGKKRR